MQYSLTIIIPAYNESQRILKTLIEIDAYITKKSVFNLIKVLIIND